MNALPLTPQGITMATLLGLVTEATGIVRRDLKGPYRDRNIVIARKAFVWSVRAHTKRSYPQIGKFLGGRNHSSAMYYHRKAAAAISGTHEDAQAARIRHIVALVEGKLPNG